MGERWLLHRSKPLAFSSKPDDYPARSMRWPRLSLGTHSAFGAVVRDLKLRQLIRWLKTEYFPKKCLLGLG